MIMNPFSMLKLELETEVYDVAHILLPFKFVFFSTNNYTNMIIIIGT